ncbi:MAG TPA: arabinofuranosidase catalytic domain-containing protein [Bryobacteraceae bacterium]|nr:arabinofuranosidase catalytic domain-containing protein [Bryobacteraceae bacterium]
MTTKIHLARALALALSLTGGALTLAAQSSTAPARAKGPCDIYGAAGTPCVAAHSTTRALYAAYNGPLYQVKRESDGKLLDIGVAKPKAGDSGGYADAAAQDAFCANTLCVINLIYDQSGKGNHLPQAPPGPSFPGPAKGGFDTQPIADMAPVTIMGHKVYGVFIMPGMGFRNNNASGLAIGDEPEGMYYVVDGTHFDSGCCFDYGNAERSSRAEPAGTMETAYFGTSTAWGSGNGAGPWIMADMEAGVYSGYNLKQNTSDPAIDSWRFVTAVVDGGGGNQWDIRGGDAQKGPLTTFYSGARPGSQSDSRYYPMHRQGGILLGTGGDNGNGSSGTFYEGVMTTGYPSAATTDAVQANIVAAQYGLQPVRLSKIMPFTPRAAQDVTVTFTNPSGAPAAGIKLSISIPAGWTASASGGARTSVTVPNAVAPGATASATFRVVSAPAAGAGFLTAKAEWGAQSESVTARLRNVLPVKINEVRFGAGANATNQFIELYNASGNAVDLSNWSLINTQSQWASVKLATAPEGAKLAPHGFYLLGLASSGLAAPARAGDSVISVRSVGGFAAGQSIDVDGETRTIASVGTAAAPMTTVFLPVSAWPWITIPAGSTNLPVTSASGFEAGQKIGIDLGGAYEVATVTATGKPATQTTLAAAASAGATAIKVAADSNMTVGDALTVEAGAIREVVNIASIGADGINLAAPLKFSHAAGIGVSDAGTGIAFSPATKFPHASGDAVQALGSGVTLNRPLAKDHPYGAAVVNPAATAEGYQERPAPNQWFGGALSARAGSIALLDSHGVVVDAIVYGSQQSNSSGNGTIASPELATLETDQGKGGCIVVAPAAAGGRGGFGGAAGEANKSVGRFPDGADNGSLCTDFLTQSATTLAMASGAGATNIKVASVADFGAGQTVTIDSGANSETATIAAVGTAGATTVETATTAGATAIPVVNPAGFAEGQAIEIDSGANRETAVVASVSRGARGGRGGGRGAPGGGRGGPSGASITVSAPLGMAHAAGTEVAGTGLTLAAALAKAHAAEAQVAGSVPTPGAPNKFYRRP